jgi:hypothetical protein
VPRILILDGQLNSPNLKIHICKLTITNVNRAWVREHSKNYIVTKFIILCNVRREAYKMKVEELTERAQFYYNAPPHPSEITSAMEEFKKLINRDWQTCVAMYPKTMDYFFSLVGMNLPDDKDPRMNYLREGENGVTGHDLQELVKHGIWFEKH